MLLGRLGNRSHKVAVGVSLVVALIISVAATLGGMIRDVDRPERSTLTLQAPRVVVLKAERVLHLFDGAHLIRSYPIDLGWAPVGRKQRQGDGRTPTGTFRVATRNAASRYHRFLGIDYPSKPAVGWGLEAGLISAGEAVSIRASLAASRCPDWSTALGGGIGIHGHRLGWDWTAGCIALADEHAEELFAVLRLGDPVEILP